MTICTLFPFECSVSSLINDARRATTLDGGLLSETGASPARNQNVTQFRDDAQGLSLESLDSLLLVEARGIIDKSPGEELLTRYRASYWK